MTVAPPTPQDKLTVRHEYMDVENVLGMWRSGQLLINEEYQRSEVWNESKKRLLIDSLIKGYSISSFIFRDRSDGKSEVLDGQQRLRSLDQFTTDQFPFRTEVVDLTFLDNLTFSGFPEKIKYSKILARHVHIVRITSDDEGLVTEIFLRLQEGMPLNSAEKLHAMRGKMRDAVIELAQEPFLKRTGVSQFRFNHRYVMAQALAAEMKGLQNQNFTQLGAKLLRSLYAQHEKVEVSSADVSRVRAALRFLERSLQKNAHFVETNPDLLTITSVASYLLEHYAIRERGAQFDDFILDFLSKLGNVVDEPYMSYAVARSTATVSKDPLRHRFEGMFSACLEFMPGMPSLDPQRQFDRGMKLALYRRANGKCEVCGTEIRFNQAEADHAFAWSRGGPTTLENAQLLCVSCNRSKGAS